MAHAQILVLLCPNQGRVVSLGVYNLLIIRTWIFAGSKFCYATSDEKGTSTLEKGVEV